ncbi:hypothetical protein LTR85_000872 [Meristemomyces frigidus]|nr:hypothetical protein LTR85_000872 [Meristemomyces frigidus]
MSGKKEQVKATAAQEQVQMAKDTRDVRTTAPELDKLVKKDNRPENAAEDDDWVFVGRE